jgi:protein-tyrosine phosphatase
VAARDLAWDGCLNVRDLGGHPTEDGRETRFGAVVRADSVRKLSPAGWESLVAHGIRTIVDLRFHSELEADPPLELPVDVVHVPVFPEPSPEWLEIDAIGDAAGPGAPGIRAVYAELLKRRADRFVEAVTAVARAPEGGVVVHCTAGKDRTGLVTALLLRLARVPIDDVAADYAATTANLRDDTEAWIAAAANEGEREWRRRVSGSPPEAMAGVLADLGDVAAYLRAAGAADADLERARGRLLGTPRMAAA